MDPGRDWRLTGGWYGTIVIEFCPDSFHIVLPRKRVSGRRPHGLVLDPAVISARSRTPLAGRHSPATDSQAMSLRVGHIIYANCAPFFHYLTDSGFDGRIVPGVPSRLNAMLAAGDIDVSPSSSFEYARNWRDYLLLPGQSISSFGPVRSVLFFSSRRLEELDHTPINLTGESATSVNLLKILLREFLLQRHCHYEVPEGNVETLVEQGESALLIGDHALRMRQRRNSWRYCYDLGELWVRFTGLPFVFALWILRRDTARKQPDAVRQLMAQLDTSRRQAFASLEKLAAASEERAWYPEAELVAYWRCMDYDLTPTHIAGLQLYYELCLRHGLLNDRPELQFFE